MAITDNAIIPMDKLKVFTAFSGYDSQCMALDRIGVDYELVGWSEIDKYAIQAHNAVYPQYAERNFGDIANIDWDTVPQIDLFTYSSPCQDFSQAGLQRGGEKGSGTRSSLLWECEKCIIAKRPKYLLMENVAALVSNKFIGLFNQWQSILESYGYHNYVAVLNAKDYGVPQNRKRVFMVSKLDEEPYFFPQPFKLQTRLKDVLEDNVDEKFYLSDKIIQTFLRRNKENKEKGNGFKFEPIDVDGAAKAVTGKMSRDCDNYIAKETDKPVACAIRANGSAGHTDNYVCTKYQRLRDTIQNNPIQDDEDSVFIDAYNKRVVRGESGSITTRVDAANMMYVTEPNVIQVGNIAEDGGGNFKNPQRGRIYSVEGCSPCINANRGGNLEPKILGYTRDKQGKVQSRHLKDISGTITQTASGGSTQSQYVVEYNNINKKDNE